MTIVTAMKHDGLAFGCELYTSSICECCSHSPPSQGGASKKGEYYGNYRCYDGYRSV